MARTVGIDRDEVFETANRLEAEGKEVTCSTVFCQHCIHTTRQAFVSHFMTVIRCHANYRQPAPVGSFQPSNLACTLRTRHALHLVVHDDSRIPTCFELVQRVKEQREKVEKAIEENKKRKDKEKEKEEERKREKDRSPFERDSWGRW